LPLAVLTKVAGGRRTAASRRSLLLNPTSKPHESTPRAHTSTKPALTTTSQLVGQRIKRLRRCNHQAALIKVAAAYAGTAAVRQPPVQGRYGKRPYKNARTSPPPAPASLPPSLSPSLPLSLFDRFV